MTDSINQTVNQQISELEAEISVCEAYLAAADGSEGLRARPSSAIGPLSLSVAGVNSGNEENALPTSSTEAGGSGTPKSSVASSLAALAASRIAARAALNDARSKRRSSFDPSDPTSGPLTPTAGSGEQVNGSIHWASSSTAFLSSPAVSAPTTTTTSSQPSVPFKGASMPDSTTHPTFNEHLSSDNHVHMPSTSDWEKNRTDLPDAHSDPPPSLAVRDQLYSKVMAAKTRPHSSPSPPMSPETDEMDSSFTLTSLQAQSDQGELTQGVPDDNSSPNQPILDPSQESNSVVPTKQESSIPQPIPQLPPSSQATSISQPTPLASSLDSTSKLQRSSSQPRPIDPADRDELFNRLATTTGTGRARKRGPNHDHVPSDLAKEAQELAECTFQPDLSASKASYKPSKLPRSPKDDDEGEVKVDPSAPVFSRLYADGKARASRGGVSKKVLTLKMDQQAALAAECTFKPKKGPAPPKGSIGEKAEESAAQLPPLSKRLADVVRARDAARATVAARMAAEVAQDVSSSFLSVGNTTDAASKVTSTSKRQEGTREGNTTFHVDHAADWEAQAKADYPFEPITDTATNRTLLAGSTRYSSLKSFQDRQEHYLASAAESRAAVARQVAKETAPGVWKAPKRKSTATANVQSRLHAPKEAPKPGPAPSHTPKLNPLSKKLAEGRTFEDLIQHSTAKSEAAVAAMNAPPPPLEPPPPKPTAGSPWEVVAQSKITPEAIAAAAEKKKRAAAAAAAARAADELAECTFTPNKIAKSSKKSKAPHSSNKKPVAVAGMSKWLENRDKAAALAQEKADRAKKVFLEDVHTRRVPQRKFTVPKPFHLSTQDRGSIPRAADLTAVEESFAASEADLHECTFEPTLPARDARQALLDRILQTDFSSIDE